MKNWRSEKCDFFQKKKRNKKKRPHHFPIHFIFVHDTMGGSESTEAGPTDYANLRQFVQVWKCERVHWILAALKSVLGWHSQNCPNATTLERLTRSIEACEALEKFHTKTKHIFSEWKVDLKLDFFEVTDKNQVVLMDVNPSKSAGIKVEIAYGSPDALLAHAVIVAADPFAPLPTVQVKYSIKKASVIMSQAFNALLIFVSLIPEKRWHLLHGVLPLRVTYWPTNIWQRDFHREFCQGRSVWYIFSRNINPHRSTVKYC